MKKALKQCLAIGLAVAMALMTAACGASSSAPAAPSAGAASSAPADATPDDAAQGGEETSGGAVTGGSTDSKWYEGQTINIYVPANASSPLGIQVMRLADYLSKTYGNNWVVTCDNTGNGTYAFETVANAEPDGLTILFTQNLVFAYYGGVYDKFATDILIPVNSGGTITGTNAIAVRADAPYNTVEEMVEYANANNGLLCGIQNKANSHVMSGAVAQKLGMDTIYVETGGSSDKITALLGGQIDWALLSDQSAKDYVTNGDIKYLMFCGDERDPNYPDVPCEADLGLEPTITTAQPFWYMPIGTDPDIVYTFNDMVNKMADDEELTADLLNMQTLLGKMSVEEAYDFQLEVAAKCKEGFAAIGEDVSSKK